jgi:hypothetical protein
VPARRVFPPLAAVAAGLTVVWFIAVLLVAIVFFDVSLE